MKMFKRSLIGLILISFVGHVAQAQPTVQGNDTVCLATDLLTIPGFGLPNFQFWSNNFNYQPSNQGFSICNLGNATTHFILPISPDYQNIDITLMPEDSLSMYEMVLLDGQDCAAGLPPQSHVPLTDVCAVNQGDVLTMHIQQACVLGNFLGPFILQVGENSTNGGGFLIQINYYNPINVNIATSTNDTIFCAGDSITLDAGPGFADYVWDNGVTGQTQTVFFPGTYTVFVTNSAGCTGTGSITVVNDTDCVWPGDANKDGITNANDLLPIGLMYDSTGFTRPLATLGYYPQTAPNWPGELNSNFFSHINLKHIDCDGNGIIDSMDIDAINLNYGRTHQKTEGARGGPGDPPLFMIFAQDTFEVGDTVFGTINLGVDTASVTDAYGWTFDFNYDNQVIDTSTVKIGFDTSFLDNDASAKLKYQKNLGNESEVDLSYTRTNGSGVNGWGPVATFVFVLEDNIDGRVTKFRNTLFDLMDVVVVNNEGDSIDVFVMSDSITITQFCDSKGDSSQYEWIQAVCGNNTCLVTGNNGGYAEFNPNVSLNRFFWYTFKMRPKYLSTQYVEHWRVWMDLNRDGDFNDTLELIVDTTGIGDIIAPPWRLPIWTELGMTTIRFQMKRFDGTPPEACEDFTYGEVEDYNINVKKHPAEKTDHFALGYDELGLKMFPNPTRDKVQLIITLPGDPPLDVSISLMDYSGKQHFSETLKMEQSTGEYELNTSRLPTGIYHVVLTSAHDVVVKKLVVVK